MSPFRAFIPMAILALGACNAATLNGVADAEPGTETVLSADLRPPGAPEGTCWGKSVQPAIIETVTEQILVQPAEMSTDGTVTQPAAYKTETLQRIVRPREETWFQAPCAHVLTEDFIASVQRALKVRKYYRSRITGVMDVRTRAAIRRYQSEQGLVSGVLALETARQLGLVAVERDT